MMTYICYRGIEISARLQYVLLAIEVVVLVAFAVTALVKVYSGNGSGRLDRAEHRWLWPDRAVALRFVAAILAAVFIYWGWDTAVAVNEEADDPADPRPGRGDLDRPAAGHLRARHRGRAGFAGVGTTASDWATRTTPTTCSPCSGTRSSATAPSARSSCCC